MTTENFNKFGPRTAYQLDDQNRIDAGVEAEKLVKTHCCFCGQQCGMQLKVHDNKIIHIEEQVNIISINLVYMVNINYG